MISWVRSTSFVHDVINVRMNASAKWSGIPSYYRNAISNQLVEFADFAFSLVVDGELKDLDSEFEDRSDFLAGLIIGHTAEGNIFTLEERGLELMVIGIAGDLPVWMRAFDFAFMDSRFRSSLASNATVHGGFYNQMELREFGNIFRKLSNFA